MYVRVILQMVQLNPIPVFSAKKKFRYHLTENFERNFRTNDKRSEFQQFRTHDAP